jgi:hypothetical protein
MREAPSPATGKAAEMAAALTPSWETFDMLY